MKEGYKIVVLQTIRQRLPSLNAIIIIFSLHMVPWMSEGMNSGSAAEHSGINVENEFSLHASLKRWFSEPGDRFEVRIGRYIADILRGNDIIEVQTRNFSSVRWKLWELTKEHPVTMIHPIAKEKWLVYRAPDGSLAERRKSSKRGELADVFEELVYIPDLINHHNFTLKVAMTKEEEIRKRDGMGAWRRKGISIKDRRLLDVVDIHEFKHCEDFLRFIPEELEDPFTNKQLANALDISLYEATRMTWCLRKMVALRVIRKNRNEHLHERVLDDEWECWND
jgi:hypothetical protein